MRASIVGRVVVLLVVLGIVAALGVGAYNAGVAQGLATPRGDGAQAAPYIGPAYYPRFGLGFLCLVPLLLFFLFPLFGLWRRPWGWHGSARHAEWGKHVPSMFEEWHRRAHEPKPDEQPKE